MLYEVITRKKRNGFSLVELLAVIILLGIISLIIVPSVLKTLENSKKDSFHNSVVGLITSATNYVGENDFKEWTGGLTISYRITSYNVCYTKLLRVKKDICLNSFLVKLGGSFVKHQITIMHSVLMLGGMH